MPTRRRFLLCTLAVPLALGLGPPSGSAAAAEDPAKIRVLLLTGDDLSPSRDWLSCAVATREVLLESRDFEVSVVGSATVLEIESNLTNIDVIYFSMVNACTPTLSDRGKQNLLQFVRSGKGFVVSHLASASFPEWDEFKRLCGRVWVTGISGHGPRSVFRARIADPEHPITRGLADFQQDDLLHAKLQGDTPIRVLVTADSEWSGDTEPLAFVLPYGQGRVFHHTLGHDAKAILNPTVKTLILRGTAWAAGRAEP
jgi:uncharacterized protein